MILPVGTKVEVTEGDSIRKKGSVGYASSFLPVFGSPCIDVKQFVVFTRIGKKGKSRLVVMPVSNQVMDYENIVPKKDFEWFDKASVMHRIRARAPEKCTKYRPLITTKIESTTEDALVDLAHWDWVEFFAYVIAELIHLDSVDTYYQAATTMGPYRINSDANIALETLKLRRYEIPNPAAHGGLMDCMKHRDGRLRAAKTLLKSITKDGEYNIDYMQAEFRDYVSRRRIMEMIRRAYAMSTPALKFYASYLRYYQAIASDFANYVLKRYKQNKDLRHNLDQMYQNNPERLNSPRGELFSEFAISVTQSCRQHGRHTCKYVEMLPDEVQNAEIVSSHPEVRHNFRERDRRPRPGGRQLRHSDMNEPVAEPEEVVVREVRLDGEIGDMREREEDGDVLI